jgi:hypothetical protein
MIEVCNFKGQMNEVPVCCLAGDISCPGEGECVLYQAYAAMVGRSEEGRWVRS